MGSHTLTILRSSQRLEGREPVTIGVVVGIVRRLISQLPPTPLPDVVHKTCALRIDGVSYAVAEKQSEETRPLVEEMVVMVEDAEAGSPSA